MLSLLDSKWSRLIFHLIKCIERGSARLKCIAPFYIETIRRNQSNKQPIISNNRIVRLITRCFDQPCSDNYLSMFVFLQTRWYSLGSQLIRRTTSKGQSTRFVSRSYMIRMGSFHLIHDRLNQIRCENNNTHFSDSHYQKIQMEMQCSLVIISDSKPVMNV